MKSRVAVLGAIATIVLSLAALPAHALPNAAFIPCQEAIAKNAGKFVNGKLKAIQKCKNKDLKTPGSCDHTALNTTIAALQAKMNAGIEAKCNAIGSYGLSTGADNLGFPGKCDDVTPGNAFQVSDLEACLFTQHEATVDALIDAEYGTTTGPITDSAVLKCQTTVAKDGGKVVKLVLKAVQKCRNAINKGTITGLLPKNCATGDAKTAANVTKATSKAQADIAAKCTDAQVTQLDICNPNATTGAGAASCTVSTHQLATDDPDPTSGDLLDYEYATPASCGDGVINQPIEECDGTDLSGCTAQGFSGPCGSPTGNFACLCLDIPRERAIEHSNSDLDNGWSGQSHDSGTVEGGGYVSDIYDCDGPGGPDTLCTVGPSCVGAPHSPCTKDADCTLQGGTCRQRAASIQRPHCSNDITQSCPLANNYGSCGDPTITTCVTTPHGAPLPLSSGGIPVCVVNVFSEDVTGTKDLASGQSAVRVHQGSITNLSSAPAQPCPVCGGFCGTPNASQRRNCTTDADCAAIAPAGTIKCNHDAICSGGPNIDKECRPNPPFGGPTALFGNPSVDCPPTSNLLSGATGLDILFNPATTGTTTMTPSIQCDATGFTGKRCMGGSSDGRTCTTASECPGGTCSFQCYCPTSAGGTRERPNDCDAACLGGSNDAVPCTVDSECPGGFCHPADCRIDPGAPAYQQPNEGGCTATVEGRCSASAYRSCNVDLDYTSAGGCSDCQSGETCVVTPKNCFMTNQIVRSGQPGVPDSISASTFCIPNVNKPSVNTTAGLPGPGALLQPTTTDQTGF